MNSPISAATHPRVIGVDLDNTIIDYSKLLWKLANTLKTKLDLGPVRKESAGIGKMGIRDEMRKLPDGEKEWQKLQALAYGQFIGEAVLFEGTMEFFRECRAQKIQVFIVSHKTEFSKVDSSHTNLRGAAVTWLVEQGFFSSEGAGLKFPENIFFESSRLDKIKRISALKCEWFIDDLVETFEEPSFPSDVGRILFSPGTAPSQGLAGLSLMKSWKEIHHHFFGP